MSNYEKCFEEFMSSLTTDQAKQDFYNDPIKYLSDLGIPLVSSFDASKSKIAVDFSDPLVQSNFFKENVQAAIDVNGAQLTIDRHWWGIDFILNEELTQLLIHFDDTDNIAAIITTGIGAIISGPAAAALGMGFAIALMAKREQIKFVNKGKGVYFPITWAQWGGLLSQAFGGVTALVAAILVLVHPFSN